MFNKFILPKNMEIFKLTQGINCDHMIVRETDRHSYKEMQNKLDILVSKFKTN